MGKYDEQAREIIKGLHTQSLKILVWGPGKPGASASHDKQRVYEKRIQIRDVLKKEFPNAEVSFSEDKYMVNLAERILRQLTREALHAKMSDLVIMLDLGRGVDLELDHFVPSYPWFREKAWVLLPAQYVGTQGLVKEILKYLNPDQILGFSKEEFRSCKVATVKVVKIAETVAMDKFLFE